MLGCLSSVIRCMHRKYFVVVVVEIALILTALSIGTLRVIQRLKKYLSHLGWKHWSHSLELGNQEKGMRYNRFRPCCYSVLKNISAAVPQCIQLSEFSPNADDIVILCITLTEFTTWEIASLQWGLRSNWRIFDDFYAENHRGLTSQEHTRFLSRVNAVRDLRNEPLIDLVTLRDALSIWTPCNTEIAQSKTIHGFIDGFYMEKHR